MDTKSSGELSEIQYWWVLSVSVLGPLASIWIETAWVFRREIRHYQALIYYYDRPALWIIAGLEFFFTMSSLILLRRWLSSLPLRWGIVFSFYALWTYVAFLIMPGVHR